MEQQLIEQQPIQQQLVPLKRIEQQPMEQQLMELSLVSEPSDRAWCPNVPQEIRAAQESENAIASEPGDPPPPSVYTPEGLRKVELI